MQPDNRIFASFTIFNANILNDKILKNYLKNERCVKSSIITENLRDRENSKDPLNCDNAIFQRKINKRISVTDDLINSVFTPSFLRARLIECFEATSSRNKPVFIVGHEQQCPRARRTSRFRKAILVGPRPMLPRRGVAVSHVFSRPCEYKLSTVQSY